MTEKTVSIVYSDSLKGVSVHHLRGFFVGWSQPPSPETHLTLLRQSDYVGIAKDDDSDRVIGFVTAISDGILSAYIPFLEVLPEFQNRGIGRQLMRRMLDKLSHFYMVDLTCDKEMQSFYLPLRMKRSTGMMIRRYDRQAGG